MTQNLLSIRNDTLDLSHGKALYSHCTHNSKILWLLFPTSVGRLGYRISHSGKCFSRTTPNIIVRTLQAGRINHMYSSQNSLILCFIILIFKWFVIGATHGSLHTQPLPGWYTFIAHACHPRHRIVPLRHPLRTCRHLERHQRITPQRSPHVFMGIIPTRPLLV